MDAHSGCWDVNTINLLLSGMASEKKNARNAQEWCVVTGDANATVTSVTISSGWIGQLMARNP